MERQIDGSGWDFTKTKIGKAEFLARGCICLSRLNGFEKDKVELHEGNSA